VICSYPTIKSMLLTVSKIFMTFWNSWNTSFKYYYYG